MATITSGNLETKFPGLPASIFGWVPWLFRFAVDPLASLEKLRAQYGDMVRLRIPGYSAVVIFDPEYNRHILRDPSIFFSYDTELIPVPFPKNSSLARLTTGLPLMNGPRHNDHRTALLPYFHKKFITRYHDSCIEVTERKIATWMIGAGVDMRAEMEQLAIWLATEPVLGLDPEQEGEAIGRQLERTMKMVMNPFVFMFPFNIPGVPFHRILKDADKMEQIVRHVIARKKQEGLTGNDILSIMIQMHEQDPERLSEEELLGHTTTMFRGGYNPSGMALYWTIFLLSQHPEKLKKVLEELDQKISEDHPKPEEVEELPYLEGAIKEAMRLFPAGAWTARLAMQDFEFNSNSFPKGTWIIMSPYITHRIPEVFPEPYKFMPERWLSIHPSAYEFMPFSAGPRYCIGTSLAMMQLKIALSIIVRRFVLTLKPGTTVECVGMNSIRPKHGLPMIVHEPEYRIAVEPIKGNIHTIVELENR